MVESPTALKRWIAIEMSRLRTAAGKEPAAAAERIGKARTVISHIETGRNLPTLADLEVLLNYYGHPERVPFFRELIQSAKRGKDWWVGFKDHMPDIVPSWFELYLGLESAAAHIRSYDSIWVPGLAQTEAYAREVYRTGERQLTEDEIDHKVKLRLARQSILTRPHDPPQVIRILDHSVLYRQVGDRAAFAAQLQHLLALSELDNVTILVLPRDVGAHAGGEGSFTILDYPERFEGDPGTVYVETRVEGLYYDDQPKVDDYRRTLTSLLNQASQNKPEKSRELINKALKEL